MGEEKSEEPGGRGRPRGRGAGPAGQREGSWTGRSNRDRGRGGGREARSQWRSGSDRDAGGRGGRSQWRSDSDRDGSDRGGRSQWRPRSGDGSERGQDRRPRLPRAPEPSIPEHLEARQLDKVARRELLTLSKENADGVARHLLASGECLEQGDLDGALAHAQNAARRAGRVAVVREALGFVHYRRAEWSEALREFRTARRLSGSDHLLPHMADVERGLGRPDRAIELSQEPAADNLAAADRVELAIVVSGARRDLGQHDAAVQSLRELVQASPPQRSWAGRLYYAYAEALLGVDDEAGAREWFSRAVDADKEGVTDAADRLSELDGVDIVDFGAELGDDEDATGEDPTNEDSAGEDPTNEHPTGEDQ